MKISGRYRKPGQPARWICVEIPSEEEAARAALPAAPEGWELDGIARGDHSEGSDPLEAPDAPQLEQLPEGGPPASVFLGTASGG